MADEPVNLNRFRKRRARAAEAKRAEGNRARHGLTKGERERIAREEARKARWLEGHRTPAAEEDSSGDEQG